MMSQKAIAVSLAVAFFLNGIAGCATFANATETSTDVAATSASATTDEVSADTDATTAAIQLPVQVIEDNYRTWYEVFLYSFYDSDGDGIGDIQGLISQLDYINDGNPETTTDLGMNGIWLMPIMPSTTYHKYDVMDYENIDAEYGTMEDFETLITECHSRGIRVIIDLVLNHTSSKHQWFLDACSYLEELGDGDIDLTVCPTAEYYHFSKKKLAGYYQVPGSDVWYYEAQFWSEMPDLNLESEAVRTEIEKITQFWFDKGVDGFRLDAVKEFETGADSQNIAILSWFTDMVKAQKEDAYLVGEMWNDISAYAPYYASGIDSLFDFTFADKDGVIAKVTKGITPASGYGKAMVNAQEAFAKYSDSYIDAPFYTNHDMGRSAGYYAGDTAEAQTKFAGALNLLMSGSAFVYYGEELGMKGSGKDENKRAPMYWSKDSEYKGMCSGPADMDAVKMKYDSLEEQEQEQDPQSIYHYYKEVIRLRNAYPVIARGTVGVSDELSGEALCVYQKVYQDEKMIFVINASSEEQTLDYSALTEYAGGALEEAGALYTGESETQSIAELKEQQLTVPAYGILLYLLK